MLAIGKFRDWVSKHPNVTFILIINKLYDLVVGVFTSQNMDSFIYFIKHFDWIGFFFQCLGIGVAYFIISGAKKQRLELGDEVRKELKNELVNELVKTNHRIQSLEEFVQLKDQQEMDDEIIQAVSFWINAFTNTLEERNAYIRERFPKNEQKIQGYLQQHYQGMGIGIRNYYKSINATKPDN